MAIIERLFADPIAQQPEGAGSAIPPGQREHADQAFRGRDDAPGFERLEDHLAVGVAAPADAAPSSSGLNSSGL